MVYKLLSILTLAVFAVCQSRGTHDRMPPHSNNSRRHEDQVTRKIRLDVYYESLCSDSIRLYTSELVNIMKELGKKINLKTYPYGKAWTHVHDGNITFECQHGDRECYGNKLHACAIDKMPWTVAGPYWLDFNACLMAGRSDDAAADACAKKLNTTSEPIKACAKGDLGTQLLNYYGEQSALVSYSYIPHVVIDGDAMADRADLRKAVEDAIKKQNT